MNLPDGHDPASQIDLTIELAGVELEHPILNGSGTFDAIAGLRSFGDSLIREFPFSAFVSKTITLQARGGNPPPRLWETPAGMINSIGLPNKGLAGFLEHDLSELVRLPAPLVVSVAGFSHEEFARLVSGVAARAEVAAIELNVSCPNVDSGCVIGSDAAEIAALMDLLRPLTDKPLIVKLTPNVTEPASIAEAAEGAGADAISLINTLRGLAFDPETGKPWLGGRQGGLSGPAIRAVALEMTHRVCSHVRVPVIGMGGIQSGQDALDFMAAGATCVAVGTESFRDPAAGIRIREQLCGLLAARGLRSLQAASRILRAA